MERDVARLPDGRVIDLNTFEELVDGDWVKPAKPVSFDSVWESKAIPEAELRKLTKSGSAR